MKKNSVSVFLITSVFGIYSIFTIHCSLRDGSMTPGIFALLSLAGSVGLFFKKSWSKYFVYAFSAITVSFWIVNTSWYIWKNGWPYYSTILRSILGLLPGLLLCSFCTISCWVVHRYFKSFREEEI